MKIGIENKKTTIAAVTLLAIAAILLLRAFLHGPEEAPPAVTAPAAGQYAGAALKPQSGTDKHPRIAFLLKPTLDPHLRLDLLAQSEGMKYEGSGRDIFTDHPDDIPKPSVPGLLAMQDWRPPAPPPPPPINLKFWGWVSRPGEPKVVFLAQGEHGFVAREGDIVARRYKVIKIGPSSIEVEDMLSNNRQSIPVSF
jgi:hypothetical protein